MSMPAQNTSTYKAVETLIQWGWIVTEAHKLLELLEEKGLITSAEHQSLLDLAQEIRDSHRQDDETR
jgi:hypothetical protein